MCKAVWAQLRGLPLLPLANGTAGTFPKTYFLGGKQSFVLATRRQQGLLPQLKGRFVHLNATRRLSKFFERDEFLEVCMHDGRGTVFLRLSFFRCISNLLCSRSINEFVFCHHRACLMLFLICVLSKSSTGCYS